MPLARPKEKIERRVGEKLFLKGERSFTQKTAVARRPYPPGVHGKKMRRGRSEFGAQLREKQKVRYLYGIDDANLKRYFAEAFANKNKPTADTLIEFLERRLDNTVFRLGFAVSRSIARHLVSYGHVFVNGKRVKQPSFRVRVGDIISLNETERSAALYQNMDIRLKNHTAPEWLELDKDRREGKVLRLPNMSDTMAQQNMSLVVEYYSK